MSSHWDRAWESQGDDGRDWSAEFEEQFDEVEGADTTDLGAAEFADGADRLDVAELKDGAELEDGAAWQDADEGPEDRGSHAASSVAGNALGTPASPPPARAAANPFAGRPAVRPSEADAEGTAPASTSPLDFSAGVELPRRPLGWNGKPKGRALVKPDEVRLAFSPHERLLILDTWQRSGLPAGDFGPLVGVSKHTL